jgi:copper transport protein
MTGASYASVVLPRTYASIEKSMGVKEDQIELKVSKIQAHPVRRRLLIAALLAVCLALVLPGVSLAHAILLRSNPAQDAVLSTAPDQVQMWFSEALNPAGSTAAVVNEANQRVDKRDAFVSPGDSTEMDVSLQPNLSPGVYVVVWRTDSADDGHVLTGSFLFTVARPDGSVPTLKSGTVLGQNVLGEGNSAGQNSGQLDGLTLFNLLMITLVELGAVFWVGAQFWPIFVLLPSTEDHEELSASNQQVRQRFERRFSLPTLLLLLLANAGVLYGQALTVTGGNVANAFSLPLLASLLASGRFGTYWIMRMIVVVLALRLSLYQVQLYRTRRNHPYLANTLLPWINLLLGLALFISITMSSHASAVAGNTGVLALVVDWLHLVAAALWVGGMLYIATSYLSVLRASPVAERARSLVTMLPYYSPWALAGVVIMAVTGPLSATIELTSWQQLFATAYGRTLIVKVLLVGALLVTSAVHVFLLRPSLRKEVKKYSYAAQRLQAYQAAHAPSPAALLVGPAHPPVELQTDEVNDPVERQPSSSQEVLASERAAGMIAQQVRVREGRLAQRSGQLIRILRWEPVLGVAVLVCVGLLNVFGGTLTPTTAAQQPGSPTGNPAPFHATAKTTDGKLTVTLYINPNSAGPNGFQMSVADARTGAPVTNVEVSLSLTILDMDMGTQTYNLLPDGKGHFSGTGDLLMGGHWQVRIQIRTPDNKLHEATIKLTTPF